MVEPVIYHLEGVVAEPLCPEIEAHPAVSSGRDTCPAQMLSFIDLLGQVPVVSLAERRRRSW